MALYIKNIKPVEKEHRGHFGVRETLFRQYTVLSEMDLGNVGTFKV